MGVDKMAAMFAIFRGVKTVYLGIEVASRSVSVDEYKLDVVHTIINVFNNDHRRGPQNNYEVEE